MKAPSLRGGGGQVNTVGRSCRANSLARGEYDPLRTGGQGSRTHGLGATLWSQVRNVPFIIRQWGADGRSDEKPLSGSNETGRGGSMFAWWTRTGEPLRTADLRLEW